VHDLFTVVCRSTKAHIHSIQLSIYIPLKNGSPPPLPKYWLEIEVRTESSTNVDAFVGESRCQTHVTVSQAACVVLLKQFNRVRKVLFLAHARTRAVLRPLVAPKILVGIATDTCRPVFIHVRQRFRGQRRHVEGLIRSTIRACSLRIRPKT
jgi:hypothetical protein